MNIEELNCKLFTECLRTPFQVQIPDAAPITLELWEVTETPTSPRLEQFSVIFRGPMDLILPQGMYTLDHERLGRTDLFLVPIGPEDQAMCYQAVFNRFRPKGDAKA